MEQIKIIVKGTRDARYEVNVSPSITVEELKKAIAEQSQVPVEVQRLIYSGKVLKDHETVEFYKVQSGHTIHMVKGGKPKSTQSGAQSTQSTAQSGATNTQSGATNTQSGAGSAEPSGSGVPSNIAAGQGSFNPLADLTGARYAGYTQLPSASMFGPDGGMNQSMPDPEQLQQMMSNPMFQESMNSMLSNPQMVDFMINQNPQLRAMGPQVREMLQSPFFRQMMANPEMMRSMMSLRGAGGVPGAGEAFPAPGDTPTTNTTSTPNTNTNTTPANPFASLFPGGAFPGGAFPGGAPDSLFGGAPPADNRPPEERYETQLRQLNDMGFFDFDRNVAALRRTGGSVQGAVEQLLSDL